MKNSFLMFVGVSLSVFFIVSCDKQNGSDLAYNVNDSIFISKASMANLTEIALGQIAADSSKTPAIQQFGQMMVMEHSAAQQELQSIASQLGIGVTATIDADHQNFIANLLTIKDSATFDSTYIYGQVADHQNTVRFFKQESGHGYQKDIKSYMYRTLENVTIHLQQASALAQNY